MVRPAVAPKGRRRPTVRFVSALRASARAPMGYSVHDAHGGSFPPGRPTALWAEDGTVVVGSGRCDPVSRATFVAHGNYGAGAGELRGSPGDVGVANEWPASVRSTQSLVAWPAWWVRELRGEPQAGCPVKAAELTAWRSLRAPSGAAIGYFTQCVNDKRLCNVIAIPMTW